MGAETIDTTSAQGEPHGRAAVEESDHSPLQEGLVRRHGPVSNPEDYLDEELRAALEEATQEIRPIFERICQESPITTVGQCLETRAKERWPGCTVRYDEQVVAGYLQRQRERFQPAFILAPAIIYTLRYLHAHYVEPLYETDREARPWNSVAWIAALAFRTNPESDYWLGCVPPEVDPRKRWSLQQPGPVSVQPSHWIVFRSAFLLALWSGLVRFGDRFVRHNLNETIYPRKDAETLAEELLAMTMPFPQAEPKVVVVHCNHEASMDLLEAARHVVTGDPPADPLRALDERLRVPKGAKAERIAEVVRREKRDRCILLLVAAGFNKSEVGRWLLEHGYIKPRERTAKRDAEKYAARTARKIANRLWRDVCWTPYTRKRTDKQDAEQYATRNVRNIASGTVGKWTF
jgi:hypothetical protein